MKKGVSIAVILMALSQTALADNRGAVEVFVKENLEMVLVHLRDKALVKAERNDKILQIVNASFDFKRMAMLSLGKRHWPRLPKQERVRYVGLFTRHLQSTYLDKLDLYTDEELVMNPPVRVKKRSIS